jgi:hypothetical protein
MASADSLNAHVDPFALPLHVHHHAFDHLAKQLFTICCRRRWSFPQGGNICGELANRLTLSF